VLQTSVRKGLQAALDIRLGGLLIGALYAALYAAARSHSLDQFYLSAGVRVAALLVCPVRLWPYLILGEYCYLGYLRYPLIESRGIAWVIIGSAVVMPSVAALVLLHRRLLERNPALGLISVAAAAAIAAATLSVISAELLWPSPAPVPWEQRVVRYILGDLIGILAVAPLALLWAHRKTQMLEAGLSSKRTLAYIVLIVTLGLVASQLPPAHAALKTTVQLLMVIPAIAMTCLHGWRGAAMTLPALYLTLGLTMDSTGQPWSFDASIVAVQQLLAITGCALLALGASISHYYHRSIMGDVASKIAILTARDSHISSEFSLRERAHDINRVGEGIDMHLSDTAEWLRCQGHHRAADNLIGASIFFSRKFRAQASMVYPTALEHVGLYLALQIGGISDAWASTERVLSPQLAGDPCRLTLPLQLTAYRTLTDAVSLLLRNEPGQIRISARCGTLRGERGIVVIVALLDSSRLLAPSTIQSADRDLIGRAVVYGGTVQCRRNRIRILLIDS
jgi:hypothetical protein